MGKDLAGKELGSGFYQRKDGSYCARFKNRFGKRESIYAPTLKEVKKKLDAALREDFSHTNVQAAFTLDEWFEKWMDVYKCMIRESSQTHYCHIYKKHIGPVLGKKYLKNIATLDITALINDLKKRGYSFETQNKVKLVLLDMYNKAMIDDFALKNPARHVKLERDEATDRRVLTQEEQTDFFDTCKGTFYDELFTVAVLTGLRPGELFALRWKDIDLKSRTISVTRTLLYQKLAGDTKKTFHLDPPKTEASNRKVRFDERCEIALKMQFRKKSMVSMKPKASPLPGFEDLLFVTTFNTPLNSQIYCDAIKRIIRLINESRCALEEFESFSGHCFRHTYATRCFEAGVDPKVVQKQLGHASLKMTMDLYTHLLEQKRIDELEKFTALSDSIFKNADALAEERFNDALHPKVVFLDTPGVNVG